METKLIYTAINAAMKDIGYIGKERKNQQQGFMFRGIEQVMNTMKPVLEYHGIFIVPEVLETQREERTTIKGGNLIYTMHKIKFHFTATDGSEVCAITVGEAMDSADKSSNKAMSVAFKYACFQIFCIPTEEMEKDDPDNYYPEQSTKNQTAPQNKTAQVAAQVPAQQQPQQIRPNTQAQVQQPKPVDMARRREKVVAYLNSLDFAELQNTLDYFDIEDVARMTDEQVNKVADYLNAQRRQQK